MHCGGPWLLAEDVSCTLQETWVLGQAHQLSVLCPDVEEERGDQTGGQIVQAPCPLASDSLLNVHVQNLREPGEM